VNETCPRCGRRYPTGRIGLCPACLLQADIAPALLGGSLELIEEIGRGGMGLASQPDFEKRFEREARALALLGHPGIVAVHDFGREEGRSYIVMEYVEGQALSAAIPLPPRRAVEVARQVLDALAYAHGRGVVHRDIKPENILLDGSGRVKVTDFGIGLCSVGACVCRTAAPTRVGSSGGAAFAAAHAPPGVPALVAHALWDVSVLFWSPYLRPA
jgi:serine/threonine-protein kinase